MRKPRSASLNIPFAFSILPGFAAEVKYSTPAYAINAAAIGIAMPMAKLIIFWISVAKSHAWQPVEAPGSRPLLPVKLPYPHGTKPLLPCDATGATPSAVGVLVTAVLVKSAGGTLFKPLLLLPFEVELTATLAWQLVVPPGPVNAPKYVVIELDDGSRLIEPLGPTLPMLVMAPAVALMLCHVTVTEPPTLMLLGLTVIKQVGLAPGEATTIVARAVVSGSVKTAV